MKNPFVLGPEGLDACNLCIQQDATARGQFAAVAFEWRCRHLAGFLLPQCLKDFSREALQIIFAAIKSQLGGGQQDVCAPMIIWFVSDAVSNLTTGCVCVDNDLVCFLMLKII